MSENLGVEQVDLWPYDELSLSQGQASNEFRLKTPWVSLKLIADENNVSNFQRLLDRFENQSLGASDRASISSLLRPLSHFPIAYYLPRTESEFLGNDYHSSIDPTLIGISPKDFVSKTCPEFLKTTKGFDFEEWSWPIQDALAFSRVSSNECQMFDPWSLFSIARRFSLVEASESSQSLVLFEIVEKFQGDSQKYKEACALILRQNHFVTQQCDSSLKPALATAQSALEEVKEFIRSEFGHDKILLQAVKSLNPEPEKIEVMPAARALMELLKLSGSRNFLAFALAVDIFERTTYSKRDPLAVLLESGGHKFAAKQIDSHREINDVGGHENLALSFLSEMVPVTEGYAREALHFAEMISFMIQRLSFELTAVVRTWATLNPMEK